MACSQSGATVANSFSVARSVSPTRSNRFSVRTAASTCVLVANSVSSYAAA